jgi:hypothetical protein
VIGHFIVDHLHVSASDRRVIREAWDMLRPEVRRDPAARERRRAFYRAALAAHRENRALYRAVVSGRLGEGGES